MHQGGHGALVIGLRNPEKYRSISAFAPIANPTDCPWGISAFSAYLGDDKEDWKAYDATELIRKYSGPAKQILVDQGTADSFLKEQLKVETLKAAAAEKTTLEIDLRLHVSHDRGIRLNNTLTQHKHTIQDGYDHSYYFISTFIDDHLHFHASQLKANSNR